MAAIYFDFVSRSMGKPKNHGSESGQLVKAVGGWRIVAIICSSDPAVQQ
jgi:hypothetical protein